VVSGGRRVYRRMLVWTITKIARTVKLAALLTFGYIATGFSWFRWN
jgi:H+-transporting ATPase